MTDPVIFSNPEKILLQFVHTKTFTKNLNDRDTLIGDIMEVNPDLFRQIQQDLEKQ
jgi:hypothetical protein